MTELTKLEQLQKNVVDTSCAYEAAYKAWDEAWDTYTARLKAQLELANYLKEQDNEPIS